MLCIIFLAAIGCATTPQTVVTTEETTVDATVETPKDENTEPFFN